MITRFTYKTEDEWRDIPMTYHRCLRCGKRACRFGFPLKRRNKDNSYRHELLCISCACKRECRKARKKFRKETK